MAHTELGRALYPGPLLPTCLAAAALLAASNSEAREHWLPLMANGSVIATIAAANEAGHGPKDPKASRPSTRSMAGGCRAAGGTPSRPTSRTSS